MKQQYVRDQTAVGGQQGRKQVSVRVCGLFSAALAGALAMSPACAAGQQNRESGYQAQQHRIDAITVHQFDTSATRFRLERERLQAEMTAKMKKAEAAKQATPAPAAPAKS